MNDPLRELKTVETFEITGMGTAHIVYIGDEPPELHDRILLDGEVCEVTGVGFPTRRGMTEVLVQRIAPTEEQP